MIRKTMRSAIATTLTALILCVSFCANAESRENLIFQAAATLIAVELSPAFMVQAGLDKFGVYKSLGMVDFSDSCTLEDRVYGVSAYCIDTKRRTYFTSDSNILFSYLIHAGTFTAVTAASLALQYSLASKLYGKLKPVGN